MRDGWSGVSATPGLGSPFSNLTVARGGILIDDSATAENRDPCSEAAGCGHWRMFVWARPDNLLAAPMFPEC